MIGASVIVPFYGERGSLAVTLRALEAQTWPAGDREILVVDNGTEEGAGSLRERFPAVRWLRETRVGSYAARNLGLAQAAGRVVAFTDADCVPDPAWLGEGIRALEQLPATVVGGRIDYIDPPGRGLNLYERIEEEFFLLGRQQFLIERLQVAATANLFACRAAFERIGPFNPSLRSFGDGDWTRRAVAGGEKLAYAPAALVRHPRRSSLAEIRQKWLRVAGGRISLLRSQRAPLPAFLRALWTDSWLDPHLHGACLTVPGLKLHQRIQALAVLEYLGFRLTREKIRVLLGAEAERR